MPSSKRSPPAAAANRGCINERQWSDIRRAAALAGCARTGEGRALDVARRLGHARRLNTRWWITAACDSGAGY